MLPVPGRLLRFSLPALLALAACCKEPAVRPVEPKEGCSHFEWSELDARGPRPRAELRAALDGLIERVHACDAAAQPRTPGAFVVLHILVVPDGTVPSVGFDNSATVVANAPLEQCLTKAVRAARFPVASEPTELSAVLVRRGCR